MSLRNGWHSSITKYPKNYSVTERRCCVWPWRMDLITFQARHRRSPRSAVLEGEDLCAQAGSGFSFVDGIQTQIPRKARAGYAIEYWSDFAWLWRADPVGIYKCDPGEGTSGAITLCAMLIWLADFPFWSILKVDRMAQAATGTAFTLFIEEKCSCSLTRILFFFCFYS